MCGPEHPAEKNRNMNEDPSIQQKKTTKYALNPTE
jgi:hypothetical protein